MNQAHEQPNLNGTSSPTSLPHIVNTYAGETDVRQTRPFSISELEQLGGDVQSTVMQSGPEKGPVLQLREGGFTLHDLEFAPEKAMPDISPSRFSKLLNDPEILAAAQQHIEKLHREGRMPIVETPPLTLPDPELRKERVDLDTILQREPHEIDLDQTAIEVGDAVAVLGAYESDFGRALENTQAMLDDALKTVGILALARNELGSVYDRTLQNHEILRAGIQSHFLALNEQLQRCDNLHYDRSLLVSQVSQVIQTEQSLGIQRDRADDKLAKALEEQEKMLDRHQRIRNRLREVMHTRMIKPEDLTLFRLAEYVPEDLQASFKADFDSTIQDPHGTAAQGVREHVNAVGEILTKDDKQKPGQLTVWEGAVKARIEDLHSTIEGSEAEIAALLVRRDSLAEEIAKFDSERYNPELDKLSQIDKELRDMVALARSRGPFGMKGIPRQLAEISADREEARRAALISADRISDPHHQIGRATRTAQPESARSRREIAPAKQQSRWLGWLSLGKKR